MKLLALLVFTLTFAPMSYSCSEDGLEGIVPANDLYIPANVKRTGGLSEAQFNAVIQKVEAIYIPLAKGMGGNLKVARKWSDGTVNANATRMGSTWAVNMYGGLARHETITEDGFALVLCHETGHQMGGAPKVGSLFNKWAGNEGQSDYWATLKCLRKVFLNDNNDAIVAAMTVPASLKAACDKSQPNKADNAICIRGGMAGDSVARLFAVLSKEQPAKFETPDSKVVSKTNDAHPATQCRLDTYLQGALCEKSFNEDVSQSDEVKGTCHGTTGQSVGLRPTCWFKPKKG